MRSFSLALPLVLIVSQAQALVREVANCNTSDGQYNVTVMDNQGIGPVRTSHMTAVIRDANKIVGTYSVEFFHGVQSVSFGRETLQDKETKGSEFKMEGASTNFKNDVLQATITVDGHEQQLSDDNLNCSIMF